MAQLLVIQDEIRESHRLHQAIEERTSNLDMLMEFSRTATEEILKKEIGDLTQRQSVVLAQQHTEIEKITKRHALSVYNTKARADRIINAAERLFYT